jgi:hypothetical protein
MLPIPTPLLERLRRRPAGPAPFPPEETPGDMQPGMVGVRRFPRLPEPVEAPNPMMGDQSASPAGDAGLLPMRPSPRFNFAQVEPEAPSALDRVQELGQQPAANVRPTKMDRVLAGLEGGWRGFMAPRTGESLGRIVQDTGRKTFWRQGEAREQQQLDLQRAQAAAAAEDTKIDNALKEEQRKSMLDARIAAVNARKEKAQWEHEDRKAKTEQSLIARVQAVPGSSVHIFEQDANIPSDHEALNTELYRSMTMEGKRVFVPTGKVEVSDMMASFAKKELGIEVPKYLAKADLEMISQLTKGQMAASLQDQKATARLAELDKTIAGKIVLQDKALKQRGALMAMGTRTRESQWQQRANFADRRAMDSLNKDKSAADLKVQFDLGNDLAALETATEGGMPLTKEQKDAKKTVRIREAKAAQLQNHNSYVARAAQFGLDMPTLQSAEELDGWTAEYNRKQEAKRTPEMRQALGGSAPAAPVDQRPPILTAPKAGVPATKKALTTAKAVEFLRAAGGDRKRAQELAKAEGYE